MISTLQFNIVLFCSYFKIVFNDLNLFFLQLGVCYSRFCVSSIAHVIAEALKGGSPNKYITCSLKKNAFVYFPTLAEVHIVVDTQNVNFLLFRKEIDFPGLTRGAVLWTYSVLTVVLNRAQLSLLTPWNIVLPLMLLALPCFNGNVSNSERSNNFGFSTESIYPTVAFFSWPAFAPHSVVRRAEKICLRALLTSKSRHVAFNGPLRSTVLYVQPVSSLSTASSSNHAVVASASLF